MSVVSELIRTEADGTISFGNYELPAKSKKSDFEHDGDLYKVKTFKEITKLERNGMFVYESVPGTAVSHLKATENGMSFTVECPTDAQITVDRSEIIPVIDRKQKKGNQEITQDETDAHLKVDIIPSPKYHQSKTT